MPDHHTLLELVKISEALQGLRTRASWRKCEPLREALHFARDLLDLANETLAGNPRDSPLNIVRFFPYPMSSG